MTATIARPRIDWLARLRSVMVLRPGQRVAHVPGIGVRASRRAVSSGAVDWWLAGGAPTPVAVYQPIGAASLAASYVNLVNPGTYDAAPGTAPSFDAATGWGFTARTQWLNTGIVPNNNWSVLARYSDISGSGNYYLFGTYQGYTLTHFSIIPTQSGSVYYLYAAALAVAPALTAGVLGFAGKTAYRNGSADGTIPAGSISTSTPIAIGNLNYSGRTYGIIGNIQAFVIWNTSTNHATWMPAVSAAMAAL